jgi:hypothetical protein
VELDGKLLRVLIVVDSEEGTLLSMYELWRGSYDVTSERLETINAMQVVLN